MYSKFMDKLIKRLTPSKFVYGVALICIVIMAIFNIFYHYVPETVKSENLNLKENTNTSLLVNINTATAEELEELPSIGTKTADEIIIYRNNNGKFSDPKDILNVKGIGEKTYEKIKEYLTV
ncbi:MAG: helix-hairpin-helix domain-containing protein [Ruminococcus sp.]|nr:helix-hairpin-helix domain-containing protein [Ruminococcus sp.]